jgi:hypothetical protein
MATIDSSYRPSFNNCNEVNAICPVEASVYGDFFNLGGTIFYTAFYAILLIYTTIIGIRGRTWSFTTFLALGIILELMGYGARISMTTIGTVSRPEIRLPPLFVERVRLTARYGIMPHSASSWSA